MRGQSSLVAGATLLCLAAWGCSPPQRRWWHQRGNDLGDCFRVAAGFGGPVYARVKATDFAVAGAGLAMSTRRSWPARKHTSSGDDFPAWLEELLTVECGVPLLLNGDRSDGSSACVTVGPCVSWRRYYLFRPKAGTRFADRFWVGAKATLLLSAEVGLNPAEFADLLAGFLGVDLLDDEVTVGELLAAIQADDLDEARRLLAADPALGQAKDHRGHTFFHWAAWRGKLEIAELLLAHGEDVHARDKRGDTPLLWAVKRCARSKREVTALLLARGADANARGRQGRTPLHWAASAGWLWSGWPEAEGREATESLLTQRVEIGPTDGDPATPLLLALSVGESETAGLLIANGADVNARDTDGATPLHLAATSGLPETAELLIARGADINARDQRDRTPLARAIEAGNESLAECLRAHGAR